PTTCPQASLRKITPPGSPPHSQTLPRTSSGSRARHDTRARFLPSRPEAGHGGCVTGFGARGILVVMGDHDFAVMYAREGEIVLVFLARRTLDAAIAADLAAETFA